ncbi:Sec-independent protein translocase subunit TatA [Krasilnikoviella flava]|uniref:Sec-independent protein translocase protein TatA n=1 Tax=Krasilnikoviella flava TaxID=526729 RepID=A0A1T5L4X7_9MICO|nr:Sec-independent protein translocase subunit TatA [Krasilnikoviella flava]SKC71107.1 sec-independent protein translocase protein TatA [Krasilnikoviella flava]
MGMLKPWHIIVLVVVILLLFGARRLPDLARSVGQSLKIFKKEVKDLTDDGKLNDSNEPSDERTAQTPTAPSAGTTTPSTPPGASNAGADNGGEQIPGLIDPKQPRA